MSFKILHTVHTANPKAGGPIEGIKQLAAADRRHGCQVELLTLDDPDAPWVKDCPVPCQAMGQGSPGYGYSSRFVPWLRANHHRYDVVIVNGIWQYNSFGTWRALAGTSTPYFVFTHGMLDPWFKRTYPLKHLKKWLYWPWADYRVLRDARAVLFTCEEERRLARESFWLYRCNERVIGYGTSGPTGDAQLQRESFLARFPQLADKRCLLFLGRVHIKKGVDLLISAYADVLASLPAEQTRNLHLVMAGPSDDAYGQSMMQLAERIGLKERITWTGMVTGDAKWGALRAADAFILPSHQENFGIAVAEALACSVPVLISNRVNIWREIEEDGAGLVDTDNLPGTIRLLKSWLECDPALWSARKTRARECFDRRFHIERTSEAMVRTFREHGLTLDAPLGSESVL